LPFQETGQSILIEEFKPCDMRTEKFQKEVPHNANSSPKDIWTIKSRIVRLVGHMACMK